jgi:auxin responsive GH3 gene family
VERASGLLAPYGVGIVEYTSQADTTTATTSYTGSSWCGRTGRGPRPTSSSTAAWRWEEALNTVYRQGRNGDATGPLEIRVVRGGTFEEVMDNAISRGASIDQYKTPRCVSFGPIIELLNSRVPQLQPAQEVANNWIGFSRHRFS